MSILDKRHIDLGLVGNQIFDQVIQLDITTPVIPPIEVNSEGLDKISAHLCGNDGAIVSIKSRILALQNQAIVIQGLLNNIFPIGSMFDYWGSSLPDNFLWCNGSEYDGAPASIHRPLFYKIGNTYNTGGETPGYFRTPDIRGRATAGKDNMGVGAANRLINQITGTILGASGGSENHILILGQLPSHTHDTEDLGHNHPFRLSTVLVNLSTPTLNYSDYGAANYPPINSATTGISTYSEGLSEAHNNLQPCVVCNCIIRYK